MLFRLFFREPVVIYSAHEPPEAPSDRLERAEKIEFIKDGFSLTAALLPPVWLLSHNMWLELAAYFLGMIALVAGLDALGVNGDCILLVVAGLNFWFGLEASGLRRWNLERSGWKTLGTVSGASMIECERRFFDAWLPEQAGGTPGEQR